MGWRLLQACFDRRLDGMTDSEWRVFCVICRHANDESGGDCYPSTGLLSCKSRLSVNVVKKAVQGLTRAGWIRTEQAPGARRYFFVNVTLVNTSPLIEGVDQNPRSEQAPGAEVNPRAEVNPPPVQICTHPPFRSEPRREHIRDQLKEHTCMQADALSDFNLESDKPTPKRKALTHKFELEELPAEWADYCKQVRPDIDAKRAFIEFKFYFTQGQGAEKRRSERGWNQAWQGWVRRQREEPQRPQSAQANGTRKIAFGSISESYARVLASKLCKTGDVGPYGAGCMTWDEAERRITNKLMTSERDFAGIVALLKRKNILEATA